MFLEPGSGGQSEFAIVSATFVNNLRPLAKTECRNYRADL